MHDDVTTSIDRALAWLRPGRMILVADEPVPVVLAEVLDLDHGALGTGSWGRSGPAAHRTTSV